MPDQTDLISQLTDRMQWLSGRQQLLTQNIANADTPGYQAMEMKPLDFSQTLQKVQAVQLATTSPMHIAATQSTTNVTGQAIVNKTPMQVYPTGNTVDLEDETSKAAQNVMDYQLATSIYKNEVNMQLTAVGKGS